MKKIRLLFIHPNFPGQFKWLLNDLVKVPNVELAFITRNPTAMMEGVKVQRYELPEKTTPSQDSASVNPTYNFLRTTNANLFETHEVTKAAIKLEEESGFEPHAVIAHIGWAGSLFMKDVFPNTKIIAYCEWYYRKETSWASFCGEVLSLEKKASIRMQNVSSTLCMETMDVGVSPMIWQRSVYPEQYHSEIEVIHEGIDTEVCCPKERTDISLPVAKLKKDAKIITFISRALEPARGFFTFMEAVEKLCKQDKDIQFVVVGRERPAYSDHTGEGLSYKKQALEKYQCDWSRVHFTGKVSYELYLEILQNSSVHVYLSAPLFLSWSLLEAMSCGCAIVSSENAPVNEVIEHDKTGRLVNFFDAEALSQEIMVLLNDRELAKNLGNQARKLVLENYEKKQCVKKWKNLILRTIQD